MKVLATLNAPRAAHIRTQPVEIIGGTGESYSTWRSLDSSESGECPHTWFDDVRTVRD